jgi:hypothetical protein
MRKYQCKCAQFHYVTFNIYIIRNFWIYYMPSSWVCKWEISLGFHEAVGDVIALSVLTPKHLRQIGLLEADSLTEDHEATTNYLFLQGLQKVVFLPFAYVIDLWRWDVFKGKITSENYNCEWWKLRWVWWRHLLRWNLYVVYIFPDLLHLIFQRQISRNWASSGQNGGRFWPRRKVPCHCQRSIHQVSLKFHNLLVDVQVNLRYWTPVNPLKLKFI